MKNLLIVFTLVCTSTLFAQEEWGDVRHNEMTLKEIAPIWPGCEGGTVPERTACFENKLIQHIVKNFRYPATEYKKNIQGEVLVEFWINEKGLVEIERVSGGNAGLQAEAERNIKAIPKMKPGMLAGKPRAIRYEVPFNFKTGK